MEAWNCTTNKLEKLVNSMKMGVIFASLILNIIIQTKAPENCTFYG